MSLRVEIHQQGTLPGQSEAVGESNGGRGFSNAAFLIGESEDGHFLSFSRAR
jgi:hypothetical protein